MSLNPTTFYADDFTSSYTSNGILFETRGNRSGVFQATLSSGDSISLQARVSSDFDWVEILTASDANVMQEIILAPYFRIVVTNTSGNEVKAAISL